MIEYALGSGVEAFSTTRDSVLPYNVVTGHQVHGVGIAVVDRPDITRDELQGYDALVTGLEGVAIGVRTADCVPLLLYDPEARVIAAVHSGWRGTAGRIVQKVIGRMCGGFSASASRIRAVIGPAILEEAFQVGGDVVSAFRIAGFDMDRICRWTGMPEAGSMKGGYHIDLAAANELLLLESGVEARNIYSCGICTYSDSRFFSARREGAACGRIINSIKMV